ncbi:hypothetical protein GCM10007028_33100 [Algibacter mikhailovii]|uniref:Uncharacterized protein n=1 Tax=Algibacter mikhailovii TaxID=425498 RepID=A0A918RAM6_9FLAO|nr:hypothetical protein GCM10007028_33100 [Algibacter mikhailovii]
MKLIKQTDCVLTIRFFMLLIFLLLQEASVSACRALVGTIFPDLGGFGRAEVTDCTCTGYYQ